MPIRPPLHEVEAHRIALIKPSALGDIVHALPVLSALRARFPRAHITWIVNRAYEPLLQGHPDLDAILPFDRGALGRGWFRALNAFADFARLLRRQRFDLVIDLQGLFRSGLMTLATAAGRRVGLSAAREGARWFYTDTISVPNAWEIHAVDRYYRVVEALGAGAGPPTFRVPIAREARAWAADIFRDLPRPWIVLGVGSRWLTKRWLPEHFADLTTRAQAVFGGTAVFVGAPDEAPLSEQVRRQLVGPTRDLTGQTTIPQLVALLERADVMLANDTGPLHLAVALGRPVVVPYTCTEVRLTGPYGLAHRAVETTVWCRGSGRKTCNRMECMAELTPRRLWPVLSEVLRSLPLGEEPGVTHATI
jgi:lipopolysaccharide heptosyltransferase I